MATAAGAELRADVHSIEPIPEADKDSTGPQQMWIWAGANIAPINWALGALGIVLKLGLWETIAVIVLGNIVGCAIFAAFTVMGHKTGVNQMVLQRSAFGRRGAYLPSALMFVMTLGWIGVNTYFPVKIAVAILGQFGIGGEVGVCRAAGQHAGALGRPAFDPVAADHVDALVTRVEGAE